MTAEPGKNPAENGQAENGSAADAAKASASSAPASERTAPDFKAPEAAKIPESAKIPDGGTAFDGDQAIDGDLDANKASGNGQRLPKKVSAAAGSRDDARVNAPSPEPAEPTPLDGVKAVSTGTATPRSAVTAAGSGAGSGPGAPPAAAQPSAMSAQPAQAGAGRPTMSPPDAHSSPGVASHPGTPPSPGVQAANPSTAPSPYGPSPVGGPSGSSGPGSSPSSTSSANSTGTAGAPSRPGQAGSTKSARRAHLQLSRLEPWSVMKFSFVMSLVAFIVLLVAVVVLWVVLSGLGVFDAISSTVNDLTAEQGEADGALDAGNWFSFARVFGYTVLVGAVNVLLITALSTVGAVMYNTAADLVGGVEVTLKEAE